MPRPAAKLPSRPAPSRTPDAGAHDRLGGLKGDSEFITTDKPPKAIHRSKIVKVVYLFDPARPANLESQCCCCG